MPDEPIEYISLSQLLMLVEGRTKHGINLTIQADGGVCQVIFFLPESDPQRRSLSFSVVNRPNKMLSWSLDKNKVIEKLQWAIETYHESSAIIYKKLYEDLKQEKA